MKMNNVEPRILVRIELVSGVIGLRFRLKTKNDSHAFSCCSYSETFHKAFLEARTILLDLHLKIYIIIKKGRSNAAFKEVV